MSIVFVGSKGSGAQALSGLVAAFPSDVRAIVTLDDGDDPRSAADVFAQIADEHRIGLHVVSAATQANHLLASLPFDLGVVVGWYWLLPARILDKPMRGFVGVHYSLLPKYRGSAPLVWSIINGESQVGYSIFQLGPGMDDGDIWKQEAIPVGPDDTIGDLLPLLDDRSTHGLVETLPGILTGTELPTPQDHGAATYCAPRTPADGLIRWAAPAGEVASFIRAQSRPYPGAFTFLGDVEVRVWRARALPVRYYGVPGQVVRATTDGTWVVAGDSSVVMIEEAEVSTATTGGEVPISVGGRLGHRSR